jgi:hypothetical protein
MYVLSFSQFLIIDIRVNFYALNEISLDEPMY